MGLIFTPYRRVFPTYLYRQTISTLLDLPFMDKRSYNIVFHTHTVSGIIISVLLYIIFFAGSFSFFRDEINNWESNTSAYNSVAPEMNFDSALDSIQQKYDLYGRNITIEWPQSIQRVNVRLSPSKDSTADEPRKKAAFFYLSTLDLQQSSYNEGYSLGEFLYRLHFFSQIPNRIGYYLSGFVSFFFLFALLTGVIIHWDKIISNFYVFRPWSKLKTLWTDAHTALGLIGLPFQLVYAVTGTFFMIQIVLAAPAIVVLYDGDRNQFNKDLEYVVATFPLEEKTETTASVHTLLTRTKDRWPDINLTKVHISNYGDRSMKVRISGQSDYRQKMVGIGEVLYDGISGKVLSEKNPYGSSSYLDTIKSILYRLHYGDYGQYALKTISMILGFISCFVIISGVMIWLVARDKDSLAKKKRKFNETLVQCYLAICLSMYPLTAFAFILVKVAGASGKGFLYPWYFLSWIGLSLFFAFKKDNAFTSKVTLLIGSILGLLVPVSNGLYSGNWFWKTIAQRHIDIFMVDALWMGISLVGLFIYFQLVKQNAKSISKTTISSHVNNEVNPDHALELRNEGLIQT